MAIASFAHTGAVQLAVKQTSTSVAIPTVGAPTIALVTNHGPGTVFVVLGSSAVVASIAGGLAIMPGTQIALTIGAATYIAAITLSGLSGLNVAVGN